MDILKKKMKTKDKRRNIAIAMKQAENFVLREKQAENFMTEVVSQPTTMTSKVVIIDYVVQYVAVESARAEVEDRFSAPLSLTRVSVTEVEDRFSAPLSLTRVSVTRDSSVTVMREQTAHHKRSSVYEDDKGRVVMIKATPGVKYRDVDVVSRKVVKEYEPAMFAVRVDMPGEPLSHASDSVTMDRKYCYYDTKKEEVLAVQDGNSGSFLLPVKKRYEYGQVGSKKGKLEREGVLKDADEPHLPTCVLGVYWKA